MEWNDWLALAIFGGLIAGQIYYWLGRALLPIVMAWMNRL